MPAYSIEPHISKTCPASRLLNEASTDALSNVKILGSIYYALIDIIDPLYVPNYYTTIKVQTKEIKAEALIERFAQTLKTLKDALDDVDPLAIEVLVQECGYESKRAKKIVEQCLQDLKDEHDRAADQLDEMVGLLEQRKKYWRLMWVVLD